MQRALAGRDGVGMSGDDGEALAAILQHDAGARCYQPRAETVEDRVDKADGVAVLVHDGDLDGVAVRRRLERRQVGQRSAEVDHTGEPVGERVR